jgi:protoporphyrin/coproporphyrin ferrochelatase
MKTGVLLVNLGTPDSPEPDDVGRYLKQFLNDPYVIDIPGPLRWFLVNVLIIPRRKYKSAEAYKTIWGERGSPLKFHLEDLVSNLRIEADQRLVEMAMRYGSPSIASGLEKLRSQGVTRLVVVPLYPQYAESSTLSTIDMTEQAMAQMNWKPELHLVREFFADLGHADAWAELLSEELKTGLSEHNKTHVLFSYHGLPERHLVKAEAKLEAGERVCLDGGKPDREESRHRKYNCCERAIAENLPCLRTCYRAQSLATTKKIVESLRGRGFEVNEGMYSTCFQSRLGRTPWIRPYTDDEVTRLAKLGVEHLVVVTPSFVADCLETIEEIGDRARHQFLEAGGKEFSRVACLNAHPAWVSALSKIIDRTLVE